MSLRWKLAQSIEKRWWNRYLKNKNSDEYLKWKRDYWHSFMRDIDRPKPSSLRILDAGCGPAGIFLILDHNEVVAFDPLLGKYKNLSAFRPDDAPWVHFEEALLEEFSAPTFEEIYCTNAINHVRDIKAGFEKLLYLLKPGGTLIVSTDCHRYRFFKFLFRITQWDVLHPHQYGESEYATMILKEGGIIEKTSQLGGDFFFRYVVFTVRKPE